MRLTALILFVIISFAASATEDTVYVSFNDNMLTEEQAKHSKLNAWVLRLAEKKTDKNVRLIAAGLTITLGVFGAHRLYLATSPKVPAVYTITLGGGMGVLPLVDLVLILATKDITKFYNNKSVFMWTTPQ